MDTVRELRQAIIEVYNSWEKLPSAISRFRIVSAIDEKHDQYVLQHVDDKEGCFQSRLLAHLEIRNGKIWILTDNTEEGIGNELVALGVPKDKIVLAFYPPAVREMGEFAVA